jgi:hypothetical protein
MIVSPEQLKAWLDSQFDPMIESILKQIEVKKAMEEAMSSDGGNSGVLAAPLKKVLAAKNEPKKRPGQSTKAVKTMTFKVRADQKAIIEEAIDKAKGSLRPTSRPWPSNIFASITWAVRCLAST